MLKEAKKWMLGLAAVAFVFGGSGSAVAATNTKKADLSLEVLVDARRVIFDVKPKADDGTVMVPLRFVTDKLNGKLYLKGNTITASKGKKTVTLTIGSKRATINGKAVTLTKAPIAEKSRTLVPLRVISEGLGVPVEWDAVNRYVWIGSKDIPKVEDIVEAVDIKPYKHYFKGKLGEAVMENILDSFKPHTKVRVLQENDFPIIISGVTYYRMDIAHDKDGNEYIRTPSTDKGVMGVSYFFLQKGQPTKLRQELSGSRERFGDIRVHYNRVVSGNDEFVLGIKDYDKLKLKDIEYIGLRITSDAVILVQNYLSK
jgi:Copper amine oxidase N-terminal domain.